jgi:hypothetical protein
MSRAEIGIDAGPLDHVEVIPVVDNYMDSLIVLVSRDARITLQVQRHDLYLVASACLKAHAIEERRQQDEDAASEASA